MTSRQQTIASMVTVVAEGRCSLMATFQIFQFIIGRYDWLGMAEYVILMPC